MSEEDKVIPPTLWLVTAHEYLCAVHTLAISGAENDMQVRQTAPSLTLLAYAFELMLKLSTQLSGKRFQYTHNLETLWGNMDDVITSKIPEWTGTYIKNNQNAFSKETVEIIKELDPEFGRSNGDFTRNLNRLNCWTNKPFLSRYPEIRLMEDGVVDIRFMHAIGLQMHDFLKPIALKEHQK
jgi:hypothetical protein